MKKILLVSGLILVSGLVSAQEVGRVLSSTPLTREVGVPQQQCAPDASTRDACRSVTNFETRTIGYKVVYEYAGKQYTVQMPQDPGPTVNLQITPAIATQRTGPAAAPGTNVTESIYEDRWDADRDRPYRVIRSSEGWNADRDRASSEIISEEPRYVERVYVAPNYYPWGPYYYPGYYGAPYLPLLGLSIGFSSGFRGGYRGHYGR